MKLVFVILFLTVTSQGPTVMVATDSNSSLRAKDGTEIQLEYDTKGECEAAKPAVLEALAKRNPSEAILASKCEQYRTEKEYV
jgi:hypothetical protein